MSKIEIKQHDFSDCGAACLASISEHYKLSLPISELGNTQVQIKKERPF
nr:cysteine peptidase family C39 domain-containing protein [Lacinutrix neustonica]